MDRLLQTFEEPYVDRDGAVYDILLYGRSRPADTWQGWLTFSRRQDRQQFVTETETTQPSAEAVLYWATGLTPTYFDGAFARATRTRHQPTAAEPAPPPLRDVTAGMATYLHRLTDLERDIMRAFNRHHVSRLATQVILDELPHAHADIVRALEDLEKRHRYLVRRTEGGNDWLILTEDAVRDTGDEARPRA
jgi:hypothetical protein